MTGSPVPQQPPRERDLSSFVAKVAESLNGKASSKGYSSGGADGPNPVNEFMQVYFPGHALGEIIYKVIRYQKRGNLEDLEKAAAWLYLTWREAQRD